MALKNLGERRNRVHAALDKQKNILDGNKITALVELKIQKKIMAHKEQLSFKLKQQKYYIKSQMAENLRITQKYIQLQKNRNQVMPKKFHKKLKD
jgi:hypothetical protein